MNKSAQACKWSISSLCKGQKWAYLWTFTFRERLPVDVACDRWQKLQRDLVRSCGLSGVRVYEMHPGGHGLHVHLVCRDRYDVRVIRHYARVNGFGRIHVKPIPAASSDYVAKYLTKSKRCVELKGKRLWGCLGFTGCRVSDVECDSPISREIKSISNDDLEHFYKRNNWCFPRSQGSINYAKFIWARARVTQSAIKRKMALYDRYIPKVAADGDKDESYIDYLGMWVREREREVTCFFDVLAKKAFSEKYSDQIHEMKLSLNGGV